MIHTWRRVVFLCRHGHHLLDRTDEQPSVRRHERQVRPVPVEHVSDADLQTIIITLLSGRAIFSYQGYDKQAILDLGGRESGYPCLRGYWYKGALMYMKKYCLHPVHLQLHLSKGAIFLLATGVKCSRSGTVNKGPLF